jgi:predicted nuclease of predicted toxin-antitoxin system
MKLLLDSCISGATANELRILNHDVVWAGDRHPDPGDESLLSEANNEARILVTLDKDFGELAVVFGKPHHGILRIVNFRASQQAHVIQRVIELHGEELQKNAIVTAEPGRVRVRPGDDLLEGSGI